MDGGSPVRPSNLKAQGGCNARRASTCCVGEVHGVPGSTRLPNPLLRNPGHLLRLTSSRNTSVPLEVRVVHPIRGCVHEGASPGDQARCSTGGACSERPTRNSLERCLVRTESFNQQEVAPILKQSCDLYMSEISKYKRNIVQPAFDPYGCERSLMH